MDKESIDRISKKIYQKFPAVKGIAPKVQVRQDNESKSSNPGSTYTLSYHTKVTTSNNKKMPYWVRVVVDESGKIIKTTTSR